MTNYDVSPLPKNPEEQLWHGGNPDVAAMERTMATARMLNETAKAEGRQPQPLPTFSVSRLKPQPYQDAAVRKMADAGYLAPFESVFGVTNYAPTRSWYENEYPRIRSDIEADFRGNEPPPVSDNSEFGFDFPIHDPGLTSSEDVMARTTKD